MNNSKIIDIKKIVGNDFTAGIYAITPKFSYRLLDSNNNIVSEIGVVDKLKVLNIFLDKLINFGIDKEIINIQILFDRIFDNKNEMLEKCINELFKKVWFIYSRPKIDIKEILFIADLVSNRLNENTYNNDYIKEELKKRLHYV